MFGSAQPAVTSPPAASVCPASARTCSAPRQPRAANAARERALPGPRYSFHSSKTLFLKTWLRWAEVIPAHSSGIDEAVRKMETQSVGIRQQHAFAGMTAAVDYLREKPPISAEALSTALPALNGETPPIYFAGFGASEKAGVPKRI